MLSLVGPPILSPAQHRSLLRQAKQEDDRVVLVEGLYVHYIEWEHGYKATEEDVHKVQQLMNYATVDESVDPEYVRSVQNVLNGQPVSFDQGREGGKYIIMVTPRQGTVSPWSSKATDIAIECGLSGKLRRVERGSAYVFSIAQPSSTCSPGMPSFVSLGDRLAALVHDRMTQVAYIDRAPKEDEIFIEHEPKPLKQVGLFSKGESFDESKAIEHLKSIDKELGLALANPEVKYVVDAYHQMGDRNPTDAELFMFAQVNSEHCRHKIFNSTWEIDGQPQDQSLFQMIRNTHKHTPQHTLSAYSDNSAVFAGGEGERFSVDPKSHSYVTDKEDMDILIKVETHNHPTAVSPYEGAATGTGGEIRDEGATGRGSKPKVGLTGYMVSNLYLPGSSNPWETGGFALDGDHQYSLAGTKPVGELPAVVASSAGGQTTTIHPNASETQTTAQDTILQKNNATISGKPNHIASALEIMLEAPLGASAYNNEFGRPGISGFFRTFCDTVAETGEVRGYHKPIMLAGGLGQIRRMFVDKGPVTPGALLVVLGGPGMLIGLGGGAASSLAGGSQDSALDFASVQRDNPEMERRCQQVIDSCVDMGKENPIQSIHDVGAGGLSNALPEIVHDADLGAHIEIRKVNVADSSLSPMEIWCNESQERYVLALDPNSKDAFEQICKRERCPYAFVGVATKEYRLVVSDSLYNNNVVDIPMDILFGRPPKTKSVGQRKANVESQAQAQVSLPSQDQSQRLTPFDASLNPYLPLHYLSPRGVTMEIVATLVLSLPSVASKSFLITIGDRTVTGLVARDQMVGPWQVPVADVAVSQRTYGFDEIRGEAMACGERPLLALVDSAASARIAVAEAMTNLVAADIESRETVKLSANWMASVGHTPQENAKLYDAVQAIGLDLCPKLDLAIPVGKDSMSMTMGWSDKQQNTSHKVVAPLSVVISAFGPVKNIRRTWTPMLQSERTLGKPLGKTKLVLVHLAQLSHMRLGCSALTQVFNQVAAPDTPVPDVDDPELLRNFIDACINIKSSHPDLVLAYHDRSDGGILATVCEMCFAGRIGASISLERLTGQGKTHEDIMRALFNEELGAVFQVRESDVDLFTSLLQQHHIPSECITAFADVDDAPADSILLSHHGIILWASSRSKLQRAWHHNSATMQALRDDPQCAAEEESHIDIPTNVSAIVNKGSENIVSSSLSTSSSNDDRLSAAYIMYNLTFDPAQSVVPSPLLDLPLLSRPKVAIVREQGVNGHVEMAWAFAAAGFNAVDVHMSDVHSGKVDLSHFKGAAFCGGFSYGDVLGAGRGWAISALSNPRTRAQFKSFFDRQDTFALGICNGCQFLASLSELIPGAREEWPDFVPNKSSRYEGRVVTVRISETTKSLFFDGMQGSYLPIAVAHGEGRARYSSKARFNSSLTPLHYVDDNGHPTQVYPFNPNGSQYGIAGVISQDGRVLALMPHPERVVTTVSNSYYPHGAADQWNGRGPWIRIFENARRWVG